MKGTDAKRPFFIFPDCVLDVGFLLDGSRSIKAWNWYVMLSFVKKFERRFEFTPNRTRIGVVSFGSVATLDIKLNRYKKAKKFERKLMKIAYKDMDRNTAAGLKALRKQLFVKGNGTFVDTTSQ